MAREEIFEATKRVFALYASFFKIIMQEFGLEKALDLHVRAHYEQGILSGEMLKQKYEGKVDLETLGSVLQASNLGIGIDCRLACASPEAVLFENRQCPMYDGYRLGGLDDATAKALCERGAPAKLGTMLQILDPKISYCLKSYRIKADEACEEKIEKVPGNV